MSLIQRFPGIARPSTNFPEVRSKLRTLPLYIDVPLDTARVATNGQTDSTADTSGKALVLPINANFLYVDQKSNSGFVTVHFQDDASAGVTPITVYPGFIARLGFTKLIVENTAQVGKTMRFLYGVDLDFLPAGVYGNVSIDGTVAVSGNVSVIDGGKSRTLAGQAFMSDSSVSAVAGQYSHVQLKMPAASGNNRAVIRQIIIGSATAGNPAIKQYDTDLTTLNGTGPSKDINGTVSTAELRAQTNAAQLGTGRVLASEFLIASTQAPLLVMGEPIVLRPGRGIIVYHSVVNANLSAAFEWIEEANT